jgi:hypothetical protein
MSGRLESVRRKGLVSELIETAARTFFECDISGRAGRVNEE